MNTTPQFSAGFDPWIPAAAHDGHRRVSIRDAIVCGHDLESVVASDPLLPAPLIRILLAVLLDAVPGLFDVDELRATWRQGHVKAEPIDEYLDTWRHRFNVFDDEHPFLQTGRLLPTSGGPKPATALLLHTSSGNNVPLYDTLTEGDRPQLEPGDALLHVVTLLSADTASIKSGAQGDPRVSAGKTTGNPTGPLGQLGVVMPMGRSLFETLLLNVPVGRAREGDKPVWRRVLTPTWEVRPASGVLDLFTWPSRRVRMFPNDDGKVVGAVVAAGDRLAMLDPALEPHTRWRPTKGDTVPQRPIRWQPGSFAWRGLDSLLALRESADSDVSAGALRQLPDLGVLDDHYPLKIWCSGVAYGNQSAVIEDAFIDTLPLPVAALYAENDDAREALREVARASEQIRRALNQLADNLREIAGADKLPWDAGVHPGNDMMAELSGPTLRLLTGLQDHPEQFDEGINAWAVTASRAARAQADSLLDAAPPDAFAGRELRRGSSSRHVRLADVEAWFRVALNKALGPLTLDNERKIS